MRDSYFSFTAASRRADVWLTGGDNDQYIGSDERDQVSIFEIYAALLQNTPIWPALGNHDTYTFSYPGPYPFYDNFTLPTGGEVGGLASGTEFYFSFDYGNVHFISLNSIDPYLSSSTDTEMLQWLRQDLAETRQPWKIAWWHAPPYTKGSHNSDDPTDDSGQMVQMRQNVLPILEAYGVDLVLNGHSHVYERSYLLNGHYGFSWDFSPTNKIDGGDGREEGDGPYHKTDHRGAVYVVAAVGAEPAFWYSGPHPAHCVAMCDQLGSCMVDINSNRLDFQFFNADTNVLDHFTIIKDPPLPAPRITAVSYDGNRITLTWDSMPGHMYQVYLQPTLKDVPILFVDQIQSNGASTTWSEELDRSDTTGFFSVGVLPN